MSVATKTGPWKNRVVPPCSDCGTPEGRLGKNSVRPDRLNGSGYGFGPLCLRCYKRHHARRRIKLESENPKLLAQRLARQAVRAEKRIAQASRLLKEITCRCGCRKYRFLRVCDLCGTGKKGALFAGSEFSLEGKICRECRDELRDERAVNRLQELASKPYVSPIRDTHGRRTICLPVLTEGFTADELTPRAACRLLVAQFDRRANKATEPRRLAS